MSTRLVNILLAAIASERKGELVDHSLLKAICSMLVDLGIHSRDFYVRFFETRFLEDTAQVYIHLHMYLFVPEYI